MEEPKGAPSINLYQIKIDASEVNPTKKEEKKSESSNLMTLIVAAEEQCGM